MFTCSSDNIAVLCVGKVWAGGQCSPRCFHLLAPAALITLEGPEFPHGAKAAFPELPTDSPTTPEHLSTLLIQLI